MRHEGISCDKYELCSPTGAGATARVEIAIDAVKVSHHEVTVTLTKPDPTAKLGLIMSADKDSHPQIDDMAPGALAAESGKLKKKDTILSINGTPVKGATEAAGLLGAAGSEIVLVIKREGAAQPSS